MPKHKRRNHRVSAVTAPLVQVRDVSAGSDTSQRDPMGAGMVHECRRRIRESARGACRRRTQYTRSIGMMKRTAEWGRRAAAGLAVLSVAACATVRPDVAAQPSPDPEAAEAARRDSLAEVMERTRAAVPERPDLVQPKSSDGTRVWRSAVLGRGERILVSTEERALWLMRDMLVVFRAPIAVGMQEGFVYRGRTYDFTTPTGRRRVLEKDGDPIWVPPDWHYFEAAVEHDLEPVQLRRGQRVRLADGSSIEVRGSDVGRVNEFGNFYAFEPGTEIIFDGKVFIPPFGARQRQIPDVLGTHKLVLGDGYLIHGTNQETSIGDAVSHGCIRMFNDDVERLFGMVSVGTPVYIF
jgi:hypothetical protein